MPWNTSRIGARLELQFYATPPRNAKEARERQHDVLKNAIHLYLLNRSVLLKPFHNMMLICPQTTMHDLTKLLKTLEPVSMR